MTDIVRLEQKAQKHIVKEEGDTWLVTSCSSGRTYHVHLDTYSCTCKFGQTRTASHCSHVMAAMMAKYVKVEFFVAGAIEGATSLNKSVAYVIK